MQSVFANSSNCPILNYDIVVFKTDMNVQNVVLKLGKGCMKYVK